MSGPRLFIGLGNPGKDYKNTRHNFGFDVAEQLAASAGASLQFEAKFNAQLANAQIDGTKTWIVLPYSFMNLSGDVVSKVAHYYKIPIEHLLVAVDDADLPLGTLRMRESGRSGGHRGLESIEKRMGSKEYARQKLGIGRIGESRDIKNYVLGRFSPEEQILRDQVVDTAVKQARCWVNDGCANAMTRYNGTLN